MSIYKLAELWKQQRDEARQENEWMRRVLLGVPRTYWLGWVDGPWYATGDMEEREFLHSIADAQYWQVAFIDIRQGQGGTGFVDTGWSSRKDESPGI